MYGAVYVWPDGVVSVTNVFAVACEIWPALIVTLCVPEPVRSWMVNVSPPAPPSRTISSADDSLNEPVIVPPTAVSFFTVRLLPVPLTSRTSPVVLPCTKRMSLPLPPITVWCAASSIVQWTTSLPSPASIESLPPRPSISSSPVPPRIESLPAPP